MLYLPAELIKKHSDPRRLSSIIKIHLEKELDPNVR